MTDTNQPSDFDYLPDNGNISLTTFYKSGKGVATPVEYVKHNNKLFANTPKDSYKVKRLKISDRAIVAPSTDRGNLTGPSIDVKARVLEPGEDEEAIEVMAETLARAFQKLPFLRTQSVRVYIEMMIP